MDPQHWACLYNYYNNSYVVIRNNSELTEKIPKTTGVKQGGPLSPRLFSLYINEATELLTAQTYGCNIKGTQTNILLYADDTVLLYEKVEELQQAIDILVKYCREHDIEINVKKTKCFTNVKFNMDKALNIEGSNLEYVDKFKYLGWWLEKGVGNREHMKARKLASTVASYQLRKIGIDSENMSSDLKVLLRNTYCRSKLSYAMETIHLSEKEYKDLNTIEGKALKSTFKLKKYHSTTMLNNALGITSIGDQIKIRKLNFTISLMQYDLTRNVVMSFIEDIKRIPNKSIIREVIKLVEWKENQIEEEDFINVIQTKIAQIESKLTKEQNSEESKAIKYLLDKNTASTKTILNRLLYWDNNKHRKNSKNARKEKNA